MYSPLFSNNIKPESGSQDLPKGSLEISGSNNQLDSTANNHHHLSVVDTENIHGPLSESNNLISTDIGIQSTANKGKACDNCRVKKIKCDFGSPCDKCAKREEKNRKRMEKSGVFIPLLKCTYSYEVSTSKKTFQTSTKRVSEKQILDMLKEKLGLLSQIFPDDNPSVDPPSASNQPSNFIRIENNSKVPKLTTHLKKLLDVDMEDNRKKENEKILGIYSKLIDNEVRSRRLLHQIKNEEVFFTKESTNRISKLKPDSKKIKQLGTSFLNNHNNDEQAAKSLTESLNNEHPSSVLYMEQEKEIFSSSFAAPRNTFEKGSVKVRLKDSISPIMLKNILKTNEAFEKISPVFTKIKHLADLLKTDSEIYLQKLFEKMEKPFYVSLPADLVDYLVDSFIENTKFWYVFLAEKDMKAFAESFKNDQKNMDETEIFLMNAILLSACQMTKGVLYKPKKTPKDISSETLVFWESILLLNCISFYHKFLIFPRPSLADCTNLNALLKSTIRKLQSLFLLGYYFSSSPAPRLFVHLFSIVITVAQDFYFDHLNFYGDKISRELKLQARTLWVCCFIAEKHISVTFGKPEFIMGFDDGILTDEVFLDSLEHFGIRNDENVSIDYSHEDTAWIKLLRNDPNGILFVGFFLRIELLKIETVYYKTIVAAKNENIPPQLMIKKCNFILKAFQDFEVKAKKFLQINASESIESWVKKLKKTPANKHVLESNVYLFLTLNTLKLNTLVVLLDSEYIVNPPADNESKCIFQVEIHNVGSLQMSLLEYMFEKGWPICISSEIIICFIYALSPFFYNSILDKSYLRLNVNRMVNIIKKFASLSSSKDFFDPLKWNTATVYAIFYINILYLSHPDVFAEVFNDSFQNIFYDEYTKAFAIIKQFKSRMIKQIDISLASISKMHQDMTIGLTGQSSWNPARTATSSSISSYNSLQSDMFGKLNGVPSVGKFSLSNIFYTLSPTPRQGSLDSLNNINTPFGLFSRDDLNDGFIFHNKLLNNFNLNSVYDLIDDKSIFSNKISASRSESLKQTPNALNTTPGQTSEIQSGGNLLEDKKFKDGSLPDDLENLINQNFFAATNFRDNAYTEDDLLFDIK